MRLTPTKVRGWHARIERARKTLDNVEREVKAHYTTAKGGDLSELTAVKQHVTEARIYTSVAENTMAKLAEREDRKAASK